MVVAAPKVRLSVALTVAAPSCSAIDAGDGESVTPGALMTCPHAGAAANAATAASHNPADFTAPSLLLSAARRLRLRTMLTSLTLPNFKGLFRSTSRVKRGNFSLIALVLHGWLSFLSVTEALNKQKIFLKSNLFIKQKLPSSILRARETNEIEEVAFDGVFCYRRRHCLFHPRLLL